MKDCLQIFVLLLLVGCKSEPKTEIPTETEIDPTVYVMWEDYGQAHPEVKSEGMPESWFFHDNQKDADRLAKLVIDGKKRASSGLYKWYEDAGADLPAVGTKHIITNFDGTAQAIIEIVQVDTIPFKQISEAYAAMDMGTEEEPLPKWKKAHRVFFESTFEDGPETFSEDMPVVCETFKTIWP